MGYFSRFPFVTTTFNNQEMIGVNLTKRTGILANYKSDSRYFITYYIKDGETPEILADRLYDSAEYAWVVLMFNDIINPFEQWPMDYQSILTYCQSKYDDINAVHHYQSISTGLEVDEDYAEYDRLVVTNIEYEMNENDKLRNIKLLIPDYVQTIVTQHNDIIGGV